MNLRFLRPIFFLVTAAVVLCGCIRAPVATVELSEIVNEQIAAMQKSHESFVTLYYDQLRTDVDGSTGPGSSRRGIGGSDHAAAVSLASRNSAACRSCGCSPPLGEGQISSNCR